jgi:hypothetical protein
MKPQLPPNFEPHAPPGSLDLINLELDQGLLRARLCRNRPGLANLDDLRKAKAAYARALVMLGEQKQLSKWQRRRLERKLRRLQQCIRDMVIAASATEFQPDR